MASAMRDSCTAPEILPIDIAPQPFVDYSGLHVAVNQSQKEVALRDAQFEMAWGEGKETYSPKDMDLVEIEKTESCHRQKCSSDEVYNRAIQLARRHVGWILLGFGILTVTVIVKGVTSHSRGTTPDVSRNQTNPQLPVNNNGVLHNIRSWYVPTIDIFTILI